MKALLRNSSVSLSTLLHISIIDQTHKSIWQHRQDYTRMSELGATTILQTPASIKQEGKLNQALWNTIKKGCWVEKQLLKNTFPDRSQRIRKAGDPAYSHEKNLISVGISGRHNLLILMLCCVTFQVRRFKTSEVKWCALKVKLFAVVVIVEKVFWSYCVLRLYSGTLSLCTQMQSCYSIPKKCVLKCIPFQEEKLENMYFFFVITS